MSYPRDGSRQGYVYAYRCGETVKIGFSKNPIERAHTLMAGYPGAVFVGYASGVKRHEGELFKLCAAQRIYREWFRTEGPVQIFVDLLSRPVSSTEGAT